MVPKHTIYCLGEVLLALDADAPLAHAESFRPRLGGDAADLRILVDPDDPRFGQRFHRGFGMCSGGAFGVGGVGALN